MKRLFFLLAATLLFSCTPENVPTQRSGPTTFSIPYGDSINYMENFDTIIVSGLASPYSIGQIDHIEFSITHPHIEDLSVSLINPPGAQFFATDMNESGANFTDRIITGNDSSLYYSMDHAYYNLGNPTAVNGMWIVYTTNYGPYPGYLSEFKIVFNY